VIDISTFDSKFEQEFDPGEKEEGKGDCFSFGINLRKELAKTTMSIIAMYIVFYQLPAEL
jgi:hypothetical protein